MKINPLLDLEKLGQSIWIDFIRRGMITSGALQRLIREDGITGVTSNPSIFEKAIAESHDYDSAIKTLAGAGKSVQDMYLEITCDDIQSAADLFRPVYDRLGGTDGYASYEVSPLLAHDTAGTINEARKLWAALNRPNVMIKVPGTKEGVPAIRQLVSEGINVNVTLLFGLPRYQEIALAYIDGLEDRAAKGMSLHRIASVASFFLSRIDVLFDPLIKASAGTRAAPDLQGQIAIASARKAYAMFTEIFTGDRFKKLAAAGARPQRLLWASTSTKNPAYSDVKYVEPLIGPETINTLPIETIDAYRDHGKPRATLPVDPAEAERQFRQIGEIGLSIDSLTQQLEDEGVKKFIDAYNSLLTTIGKKSMAATGQSAQAAQSQSAQSRGPEIR